MKLILLFLTVPFFISCQESNTSDSIQKKEIVIKKQNNYFSKIEYIKSFAKTKSYNLNIAFMVDYSKHSGKNRFFIVDLKGDSILDKGLVCHGNCKGKNNSDIPLEFSNENGSYCTSLGIAVVAKRDYSSWGNRYKYWLDGLEKTNKNMRKRVVVLHAWNGIPDEEIYPKTMVMSWGCPTVSLKFLDKLDVVLKKNKGVLIYSFD